MAEELVDPREVAWHPRHAQQILGHQEPKNRFEEAFKSGRPHHAWLMTGPSGIGKATLAYQLAGHVLASGNPSQTRRWIASRSHPEFCILERGFNDAKPRKLRAETSVDEARDFIGFFNRTSASGGWRVGLVDCADDLTMEAANALLKLVEEPPVKALILLVCHTPGKLLRTLRSRCMRLPLETLSSQDTLAVVQALPLDPKPDPANLGMAAGLSGGRPGHALQLLDNAGAKAFAGFLTLKRRDAAAQVAIGQKFSTRATAVQDFEIFMALLLDWLAKQATAAATLSRAAALAELHSKLTREASIADGYNLDRRAAIMQALAQVEDALKAA